MGLTPDQKMDLAIAIIKKSEDEELIEEAFHAAYKRLLELHFGDDYEEEGE